MKERDKPKTLARLERAVQAQARRRRLRHSAVVVLVLAAIAAAIVIATGGARTTARPPPGAAAPPAADASGRPVNGIRCARGEQVLFHIHAHLAIFVDGRPFAGDPPAIALRAHALVQLDVGARVRPLPFAFPTGH